MLENLTSFILVRLWNTDMRSCLVDYRGHNHAVWDVSASPLGCYFMSASLDKTLRLWNTEYAFPLRVFAGHNESVDVGCFVFTSLAYNIYV